MAPARRCLHDIVRRGLWCTGRIRRAFQAPPVSGAANAPAHGPELRRQCVEIMRRLLKDAAAGHPDAGARPDKFRNLQDGWHEDGGEAPSRDGLARLRGRSGDIIPRTWAAYMPRTGGRHRPGVDGGQTGHGHRSKPRKARRLAARIQRGWCRSGCSPAMRPRMIPKGGPG